MGKPFRNLDEQIDILIKRNLIIDNYEEAKFVLTKHGYYSVVNGYKPIFLEPKSNKFEEDKFRDGTKFQDIINLHDFDKKIRNELLSALEDVESTLSTNIAYILAERFGDKMDEYLNPRNFRLGKPSTNGKYQREILLDILDKICSSDEHPMKHYREQHGNVPPWILVKGATFGNLVFIYKLFKKEEKDYLISRCLGVSVDEIDDSLKEFFTKILDVFRRYRNWAAHGQRIYSHKIKEQLPYYKRAFEDFGVKREEYNKGRGRNDLLALIISIYFFINSDFTARLNFSVGISFYISKYQENNPKYFEKVLEQMGMPINYEQYFFNDMKKVNYHEFLDKVNSQNAIKVTV